MRLNRRGVLATWVAGALLIPMGVLTSGVAPAAAAPTAVSAFASTGLITPDTPTVDVTLPSGMTAADIAKDPETPGVTIAVDSPNNTHDYPALAGGEIKGRGNFTWTLKKKPYQIKLKDSASLLGMDAAKTWILLANHADASLMRNKIAFDFAGDIGMPFSPQSEWVDLRINGDYMGNYLLTEKVEVKANRVDLSDPSAVIAELDNNYGTAEDYYFRSTPSNTVFTLKDQKGAVPATIGNWSESTKTQATKAGWDDIKNDINTLDSLLAKPTPDWAAISDIIDVESFVKMYLVQEMTMNIDGANSSLYLYKNGTADTLHAGPVWDFDITLGNYSSGEGSDTKSEFVKNLDVLRSSASPLWDDLFRNPEFVKQANAVWTDDVAYYASKLPSKIDAYKAKVALSAENNFDRWPILGTASLLGSSGGTYAQTYSAEVSDLRSWVNSRQSHLRKAYGNVPVLQYRSHVQSLGWLKNVDTGQISGTVGQARRLEAFSLAKLTSPVAGSIQAKSHVQSVGWSKAWGGTSLVGTTGKGLRLEAFQLRLTSPLSTSYDISYRAHVQGIGWQPWVTNGATAGTTGQAKRIEAVQVRILAKTSPTPTAPTP